MTQQMRICQAETPGEIALAVVLFQEYASWLGVDLCFQGFAAELAGLPGLYAPPSGRLLLGLAGKEAGGCVALRPREDGICEMKRLYVRPGFRGQGLGKTLVQLVVREAKAIGYKKMRLDTLPSMQNAIRLYRSLGFTACAPYYETPLEGTLFMELQL